MTTMTALVLRDYGSMSVEAVARGEVGPDDVEIAVSHTGICGSDIHGFTGENGRRFPGQVMGHESEGRISGVGANVDSQRYAIGARVTFNPVVVPVDDADEYAGREQHCPRKHVLGVRADLPAAFADYIVVPARNVVMIPEDSPIGAGALIEPLAVAAHAVRRAGAVAGHTALVVGGGPIGQSLVIALRVSGIDHIVVSEPDAARRELIERLGATAVDPRSSESAVLDAVMTAFGGLADVGFDAVGISATLSPALAAVSLGGTVCLVGMGSPRIEIDAFAVSTAERSIVGTFTYSADAFRTAAGWIAQSGLGVEHLISQVIPPEEAPEMFTLLARGAGPAGKVLVSFGDGAGTTSGATA